MQVNSESNQPGGLEQRLHNLRESARMSIRNAHKNTKLQDIRRRLVINTHDSDIPVALTAAELQPEYLAGLVNSEPPNFVLINHILNGPVQAVGGFLKRHSATLISKCSRELHNPNTHSLLETAIVLGNISKMSEFVDSALITEQMLFRLLDLLLTQQPANAEIVNNLIWALDGVSRLHQSVKFRLKVRNNAQKLFELSDASLQYVEFIASALNCSELATDQNIVLQVFQKRGSSQDLHMQLACFELLHSSLANPVCTGGFKNFALDRALANINNISSNGCLKVMSLRVLTRLFRHGDIMIEELNKRKQFDNVIFMAKFSEHSIQVEALIALAVATIFTTPQQLTSFRDKGVLGLIVRGLNYQTPHILLPLLKAVNCVLLMHKSRPELGLCQELESQGVIGLLSGLQQHKNAMVYELCQSAIDLLLQYGSTSCQD